MPNTLWLPLAYRFLPWLARSQGALPGRRIGFGGQEARGLIEDWSRSGLSGRYAAAGLDIDLEAAMGALVVDTHAIAFDRDWLGPESSLNFLLSKMRHAPRRVEVFHESRLGRPCGPLHLDEAAEGGGFEPARLTLPPQNLRGIYRAAHAAE